VSERKHGILDEQIPDVQYVAKPFRASYSPISQLTRWRLLQTAKKLGIDEALWSKVDLRADPTGTSMSFTGSSLQLPVFNLMKHSEKNWKREAVTVFNTECAKFLKFIREQKAGLIAAGNLFPVKQPRSGGGNAPLDLRYEWAIRRFLLDTDYKELANPPFKATQVKQAVREILKLAELTEK
jgi:hypothetical protein